VFVGKDAVALWVSFGSKKSSYDVYRKVELFDGIVWGQGQALIENYGGAVMRYSASQG